MFARETTKARANTVESILTNEKYKGDAILQKSFTVDFLMKRKKVNEGEVPQYYVEGSHPAIITSEVFDAVQVELKRKKIPGRCAYTPHCFSGRIYCEECGALYGSKVWNSSSRYKAVVWQCNAKHRGHTDCSTPRLRTEIIQEAFVQAVNRIIDNNAEIIHVCEATLEEGCSIRELSEEYTALQAEMEVVSSLMQRHIGANAHSKLDQTEYQRQYDEYTARFAEAERRLAQVAAQWESFTARRGQIRSYLESLKKQTLISKFDEVLWYGTIEQVRVQASGTLKFIFKDGTQIDTY